MLDITRDFRTRLLPKGNFITDRYKVDSDVFFVRKPFFITMAKKNKKPNAEALYLFYKNRHVIIVGSGSYIFYEGRSIEPDDYDLQIDDAQAEAMVPAVAE